MQHRKTICQERPHTGTPYSYGVEGPYSYDCSGLTSWAYRQAGIAIPRSSAMQASSGTPLHSPTEGDVVKVADVMWSDYSGARRYS